MSERLTSETAAQIAKNAGLGVPDAAALLQLADDVDEAERIAKMFAKGDNPEALASAALRARGY